MGRNFCLSTGLLYRHIDDQPGRVDRLRALNPAGMEICVADSDRLLDLDFSLEQAAYLRSLARVSIHAPWIGVKYDGGARCLAALEKLRALREQTGASAVVAHADWVGDPALFARFGLPLLVENDDWKVPACATPDAIGKILDAHPGTGFCFDFAHALTMGPDAVRGFVDRFGSRISQVHISHLSRGDKGHGFLHRDAGPEALAALRYLFARLPADVPLVLECVARTPEEIDLVAREIAFLASF